MGEPPSGPASSPSTLWRIRYSPATSGAAVVLFLVLCALWLASTIRGTQSVWHGIGIVGLVVTLLSLVYLLWSFTHRQGELRTASRGGMTVLAICVGVFVELILGLLVLSPLFAVALLGDARGTEETFNIAVLGVCQPVLVGAVALAWGRELPAVHPEDVLARPRTVSRVGLLTLVGMVLTFGAFGAWIVSGLLNSGRLWWWLNGTRWYGLLIAVTVLTIIAVFCAPGIIWRARAGSDPVVPPVT